MRWTYRIIESCTLKRKDCFSTKKPNKRDLVPKKSVLTHHLKAWFKNLPVKKKDEGERITLRFPLPFNERAPNPLLKSLLCWTIPSHPTKMALLLKINTNGIMFFLFPIYMIKLTHLRTAILKYIFGWILFFFYSFYKFKKEKLLEILKKLFLDIAKLKN